jgi:hypothetical protein
MTNGGPRVGLGPGFDSRRAVSADHRFSRQLSRRQASSFAFTSTDDGGAMTALEPLINLLLLLSALSVASERLANAIKLGNTDLREKKASPPEEKARERRIALRALAASVALAVLMKADFFEILSHLEAPWDTLGWARPADDQWTLGRLLQAFDGTVVTGISLAFGSKFWHDVLDLVYGVRAAVRRA